MSYQYDGPELARQVRMLREENERLRAEFAALAKRQEWLEQVGPPQHPDDERHWVGAYLTQRERAERAEAERDTLRADAERYRWLRQWAGRSEEFPSDLSDPTNPEEMDAAIDAAISGAKQS